MVVIGFNFTEIHAERKSAPQGKIGITNNITLQEVKKVDLPLGSNKQDGIVINFIFNADYSPNLGKIELRGEIVLLEDKKTVADILDEWKKNKKLSEKLVDPVFNNILNRATIEGLIISRDIGLPPLLRIPKISPKKK